jgi:hypothetical protein
MARISRAADAASRRSLAGDRGPASFFRRLFRDKTPFAGKTRTGRIALNHLYDS